MCLSRIILHNYFILGIAQLDCNFSIMPSDTDRKCVSVMSFIISHFAIGLSSKTKLNLYWRQQIISYNHRRIFSFLHKSWWYVRQLLGRKFTLRCLHLLFPHLIPRKIISSMFGFAKSTKTFVWVIRFRVAHVSNLLARWCNLWNVISLIYSKQKVP